MNLIDIKNRLMRSSLFKDSAWAIIGNGFGNVLLLVSGIIIARLLGKDLYGEYGLVKTTMFYIASFSTFGLGTSITKFVSNSIEEGGKDLRSVIKAASVITFVFSFLLAILLVIFAKQVAVFLEEPTIVVPLRFLAALIIFRALNTTQIGVLSGYKDFRAIAKNVTISGLSMLVLSIPLTYLYSLTGALVSLIVSQIIYYILNQIDISRLSSQTSNISSSKDYGKLLKFSFPIALQESTFMICNWGLTLMIPKLCSMGELGIYSAISQWNAIILYIPSVLSNVVLSYLSGTQNDIVAHTHTLKRMTLVNFVSSLVPFIFVLSLSNTITSFYGSTFATMRIPLIVIVFSTVFVAISNVFSSELISKSKAWELFSLRLTRDLLIIGGSFFLIKYILVSGALSAAICTVIANIVFCAGCFISYRRSKR